MQIKDVIDKDIKGLWGEEAVEGEENTPVIKTNNLSYEGVISYDDLTYRLIDIEKVKKNYLQKGDLLIEKSGGTKTHSVGYVSYFDGNNDKYVCNNFILALRPNSNLIVPKYLFYNIRYLYESGNFDDCFNKTTGIQNLKTDRYLSKQIPERTIGEQGEIAKKLDLIVNVIENKRKELTLLDELIKSRFIGLFGKGLDNDSKYPLKRISEIGRVVSGATPKTAKDEYWDGDNLWITPAELNEDSFYIDDSVRKITDEGVKSCAVNLLPIGTVILSSRAPIGKTAIVAKPLYCNQGFKNIIPSEQINSVYLYELLKMETEYLNSLGRGATFKEISKQIVENIEIKVPPIELQNEFAEFVKKVDKSKFTVQKALDEAQLLFDSLMQKYFG